MKTASVLILGLVATFSFAEPVPSAIKVRYQELKVTMRKLDFKAFGTFFSPDFVSIDPKGAKASRKEFMASIKPFFESNQRGVPDEKLISATTKDGVVAVQFDFHFDLIGKAGTTQIHEVGTDYWKKVGGTWKFVKTVDKAFTVTPPKAK